MTIFAIQKQISHSMNTGKYINSCYYDFKDYGIMKLFLKKNNSIWLILLLCVFNLLVMHYYIFLTSGIGRDVNILVFANNALGISIDVCFLFLVIYVISFFSIKLTLYLSYYLSLCWAFSNIMYSRFFQHYISLSAIGQGDSLFDQLMLTILIDGIRWFDCFFIISIVVFYFIIRNIDNYDKPRMTILKVIGIFVFILISNISCHLLWCVQKPECRYFSYFLNLFNRNHFSQDTFFINPKDYYFERGCFRSLASELYFNLQGSIDLEKDNKIDEIRKELVFSGTTVRKQNFDKNIIFILMESYMSFTSDLRMDGKEITPFLNSLKKDSSVYYNGSMMENVTIGESSDGQFIYMTGLLPLRSVVTVSKATHVKLPGLPQKLSRESRMIIPTIKSIWNQEAMCKQYGFDHLYTSNDYSMDHETYLNDEQVFDLAIGKDKSSKQPFFSVILTMSMHQPYVKQIDSSFPINDLSIPKDLACYLNACHYTDHQIQRYFAYLKETGLYDNSLIVIASDHCVHNTDFGGVDKQIPLYIIHSTVKPDEMSQSECNQLDVYTTLLDLLGCKSEWYGLGRSLASTNYKKKLTPKLWNVSEWIIMGDFFSYH